MEEKYYGWCEGCDWISNFEKHFDSHTGTNYAMTALSFVGDFIAQGLGFGAGNIARVVKEDEYSEYYVCPKCRRRYNSLISIKEQCDTLHLPTTQEKIILNEYLVMNEYDSNAKKLYEFTEQKTESIFLKMLEGDLAAMIQLKNSLSSEEKKEFRSEKYQQELREKFEEGHEQELMNLDFFTNMLENQYVDLGLPSGRKWANVDMDDEYAWGSISPVENDYYSINLIKNLSVDGLKNNGVIDMNDNLTPQYDAATQNWGNEWRIPNKEDFMELRDNCIWEEFTRGWKVKSKKEGNNNCIILSNDMYWISTASYNSSNNHARCFDFNCRSRVDVRQIKHKIHPVLR